MWLHVFYACDYFMTVTIALSYPVRTIMHPLGHFGYMHIVIIKSFACSELPSPIYPDTSIMLLLLSLYLELFIATVHTHI